ncbi:MBL fold metallo-hydrolase [Flavobacteriaceae bacterium]|nr:MBL fold metallo-hydrolase [Flavobacteriaceae bacterium]
MKFNFDTYKKKIIRVSYIFLSLITLLIIIGVLFINLSPQFGGLASKQQQELFSKSKHYKDGKFLNNGGIKMEMSLKDSFKAMWILFKSNSKAEPNKNIAVQKVDSISIANYNSKTRFIWFGHSTFLLQIKGKNLLIDPMFGDVPAPNPLLGNKRFSNELPIEIEKLPSIDAVLITHDHYDHLDYESIQKLKDKVKLFFTPLGIGIHLLKWGVEKERIIELDWWEEIKFDDLTIRCTPAQHFSGRGISDREKTLWCSWIIQSDDENLFFSGDSGYASHFKEIGEQYGPFDFAFMECGQYNNLWPLVHMLPEETAQAGLDIKAKKMMPIHWGAFKLASHSWTEPVERISKKAKELNVDLVIPKIGEIIEIGLNDSEEIYPWWRN